MMQNYHNNYAPSGFYNKQPQYLQQFRQPFPQQYNQSYSVPPPPPPPKICNPPETLEAKLTKLTGQVERVSNILEDILEYNKILTNKINKMFMYMETEAKSQCTYLSKWIQRGCYCYLVTINKNVSEWSCAKRYPIYIEVYVRNGNKKSSELLCIDQGFICVDLYHHLDKTSSDKESYRFNFDKEYEIYETIDKCQINDDDDVNPTNSENSNTNYSNNGSSRNHSNSIRRNNLIVASDGDAAAEEGEGGDNPKPDPKPEKPHGTVKINGFIDIIELNAIIKISKITYTLPPEGLGKLTDVIKAWMSSCNECEDDNVCCENEMVFG